MLIDELFTGCELHGNPPHIDKQIKLAERFSLLQDVVLACNNVRLSSFESIQSATQFARLPFEVCWFELKETLPKVTQLIESRSDLFPTMTTISR